MDYCAGQRVIPNTRQFLLRAGHQSNRVELDSECCRGHKDGVYSVHSCRTSRRLQLAWIPCAQTLSDDSVTKKSRSRVAYILAIYKIDAFVFVIISVIEQAKVHPPSNNIPQFYLFGYVIYFLVDAHS